MSLEERVIREYPSSTRRMQGQKVIGVGNLILTSRRLVFLHQVELSEKHIEKLRGMSNDPARALDFALTLDTRNFQIPLASVVKATVGLSAILPLPRPTLCIVHQGNGNMSAENFMFTIPLLRGFFQFEIADAIVWSRAVRKAARAAAGRG